MGRKQKEKLWKETKKSTLLDAFIYLTRRTGDKDSVFGNHREMRLDTSDNEAVQFLMRRLEMSMNQVHILACVIFHNKGVGTGVDLDDLTGYLGAHPLELFSQQDDFNALISRGYLEENCNHIGDKQWRVRKEAMEALGRNEQFDINSLRAEDTVSFLASCDRIIREGMQHDSDGEIYNRLQWLFWLNAHLAFSKQIHNYASSEIEFKLIVLIAAMMSAEGAMYVETSDFNMVLDSNTLRRITRAMQRGTQPMVDKRIVEPFCSDSGAANADQWVLSREAWMGLLDQNIEEVNTILNDSEEYGRNLTPYNKIPERPLFFSGKTEEEVNRLREMLQEEQYTRIIARLKEKNMPTGINILLYGLPGTGKTELVQQLARETGRDLFVVDMSQIRDKYVGQSEQNLSRIFGAYSTYVARLRKTPILFCNECDAIFGSRLERTNGSVDKMENALQNILLEQMERMKGILICTTNLTSALDKAFERRFLLKIQLPKPGNEARKQIWSSMMPALSEEQAKELAERFEFSGGQIQNVTRKQIINSIFTGNDEVDFERILDDCSAETMDRTNGHRVGFE